MSALLIFAVLLFVLVLVHELGHFLFAKRAGVRVLEFGFGFPPRLFAIRRGETEYSLNALPLGGFVRLLGEEDPTHPQSLAAQSIPTRLIVLGAGSFMNGVLAVALFSAGFMMPREIIVGPVQVVRVMPDSPAQGAGLQPGDVILKVNDRPIRNLGEVHYNIMLNLGSEVAMTLQRGSDTVVARLVPRWDPPPGQGATGIVITMPADSPRQEIAYPLWEAIPLGLRQSLDVLVIAKNSLISTIVRGLGPEAVVGPIGIYQATAEVAETGFGNLVNFAAFLSLNLAILNILPFPMLDGGRVVFVLLEGVRGKRIAPEKESFVHMVGFAILVGLIVLVSYFDILRILRGETLFR